MKFIKNLLGRITEPDDVVKIYGEHYVLASPSDVKQLSLSFGYNATPKCKFCYIKIEQNKIGIWCETSAFLKSDTDYRVSSYEC